DRRMVRTIGASGSRAGGAGLSRLALGLAAAASLAALIASTAGARPAVLVAFGALVATVILVTGLRHEGARRTAHTLVPVGEDNGTVVIRAPRAGAISADLAHPAA
ncbi:MAG: hypothetical protein ACRD12_03160, partial [Acidimicrobiales bacterium]